jgi:hypothetical protein
MALKHSSKTTREIGFHWDKKSNSFLIFSKQRYYLFEEAAFEFAGRHPGAASSFSFNSKASRLPVPKFLVAGKLLFTNLTLHYLTKYLCLWHFILLLFFYAHC